MTKRKQDTLATFGKVFLQEFTKSLEAPFVTLPKHHTVAWYDGAAVNQCSLIAYSLTDRRQSNPAPTCLRLSVNNLQWFVGYTDFGDVAARRLGVDSKKVSTRGTDRLEWTVLGEELVEFARWWPGLLKARRTAGAEVSPPPRPCDLWNKRLLTTNYAWSVAANEAYSRYAARRKAQAA